MANAETIHARALKLKQEIAAFERWQREPDPGLGVAGGEKQFHGKRSEGVSGGRGVSRPDYRERLSRCGCRCRATRRKPSRTG
jgi:hypothetical protein